MKRTNFTPPSSFKYIKLLEDVLATNMGNRYSSSGEEYLSSNTELIVRGNLISSSQLLANSNRIAIITGFYLAEVESIETDGPLAALLLAEYFLSKKKQCTLITDDQCFNHLIDAVSNFSTSIPVINSSSQLDIDDYDCILSIERLGPSINGLHYSARCTKVDVKNEEIIWFLIQAQKNKIPTIGVGDGGNEIGMGKIYDKITNSIPNGSKLGCVVPTDNLIFTGISNWCYWAWVSILDPEYLTSISFQEETILLKKMVDLGFVDGMTLNRTMTVDGVPYEEQLKIRNQMINLAFNQTND